MILPVQKFRNRLAPRLAGLASIGVAAAVFVSAPAQAYTLDSMLPKSSGSGALSQLNKPKNSHSGGANGNLRVGRDSAGRDVFMLIEIPIANTNNISRTNSKTPRGQQGSSSASKGSKRNDKMEFELSVGNSGSKEISAEYTSNASHSARFKKAHGTLSGKNSGSGFAKSVQFTLGKSVIPSKFQKRTKSTPATGRNPSAPITKSSDFASAQLGFSINFASSLLVFDTAFVTEELFMFDSINTKDVDCTDDCTPTRAATDVPEPATLSLIGVGLAGLAFLRRRRRATNSATL